MKTFETWELAFAYCRELDKPVRVKIVGEEGEYMIFPSGFCRPI